ncbi:type IV secretion system protein TraC [Brevundimonas naejangsanensis]|uniref:type IV secretion system protein TraC n=1 Tax=Brevundimonas naejangsanensis TaxID=588932 RepID=UPI003CFF6BB7
MMPAVRQFMGEMLDDVTRWMAPEAPPADSPRARLNGDRLSDLLGYRTWDEKTGLFGSNSTLGWVIEVVPMRGASETTNSMLGALFTSVPVGAAVQVISYASPKIGEVVDHWTAARANQGGVFFNLAQNRREHFRKAAWSSASARNPFYFRDYRCFIAMEMAADAPMAVEQLQEARSKFQADLKGMQEVESHVLKPNDLIRLLGDILNPSPNIRGREDVWIPDVWLNNQMVDGETRYTVYRDRIDIRTRSESDDFLMPDLALEEKALNREMKAREGRFQLRAFNVKRFPEHFTQGHMSKLLGDMFNDSLRVIGPTIMSLYFRTYSHEKTKTESEMKRMRTDQAASNRLNAMFPDTRNAARDWAMVMEQVAAGATLADVGMSVISIASVKMAAKAESSLRGVFRNTLFELERADDVHLPTLLASLPLSLGRGLFDDLKKRGKTRRMPTTAIAKLAPLQGEFMGMDVPHLMLVGRRGQVLLWSNFSNKAGNHNTCIIGKSGSGKSVTMQELMAGYRGADAEVIVIDDGKSFMNSCRLLGGAFVEFDLDQKPCLNPFSLIETDDAPGDQPGEYLSEGLSMVRLMIEQAARGGDECSQEERGVIEMAVKAVWDRFGTGGSFAAVIEELRETHGDMGLSLARSLAAYDTTGVYSGIFNGQTNVDIKNPLTVFEMGALETKPDLRAVIVLALFFMVRKRMRTGGRSRRKVLIIDEAWQMLGDGAAGKFIEGFARRCRKEGGALVSGTQSLEDYSKTSGAQACFENSDHMIILQVKEESLELFRKNGRLQIDEPTKAMLASLKVVDGEYSETFIMGPDAKFLGRLVLDDYSSTLYSTTADVFERIRGAVANGVPLEEAVGVVAAERAAKKRASR